MFLPAVLFGTVPFVNFPVQFETRHALAELPWFDIDHGRLLLADRSVGPVIDVHTHFALPVFKAHDIDIERETPDSNLLLGVCCAHHLDRYANQCFSQRELRELTRELLLGGLTGRGKRRDHTAPNLSRDMRDVGVTHSLVLAIDMAMPNEHPRKTLTTARERPEFTGYGSVHPRSKRAREKFEEQMHWGARGMKLHPSNQTFRPDDKSAMRIYRWCGEEGIPVFWHCGPAGIEPRIGQYLSQVKFYEEPIRANPRTEFVLGHSGALQHREGIALQRRYPNVWLDISSLSLEQFRDLIRDADPSRILFGSDWPFYHPVLSLAKVLIATEGNPALRRAVLHDNAARLLERTGRASQHARGIG